MATIDLTRPANGYASDSPDVQSSLIAMGARPASADSMTQTMAVSKLSPGVPVPGAVTGSTPAGQGVAAVPTQIQALTTNNPAAPTVAAPKTYTDPLTGNVLKQDATGAYRGVDATAAQVYSGVPGVNGDLQAAYDAQGDLIKATQAPIDEQSIRENTVAKFQTQIDALNRYYEEQLRQKSAAEALLNQGRLGTGAAVQARRGLIGSDFGNAQTDQINQNEAQIQNSIADSVNAEKSAQIQSILGKAQSEADAEIAAKQAAKTKGAQDYIDFLKGAAQRKDDRVQSALANVIAANANPDDATLKTLADQLGIGVDEVKTKLAAAKSTAALTAQKNAPKPVEVGGVLYQVQADGTYKAVTPDKPAPEEKPIVVGGVAYLRQADGSYKSVTPAAAPKVLSRVINKVPQYSTDGGVTWSTSKGGAAAVPAKGRAPAGAKKPTAAAVQADAEKAMNQQLSKYTGGDGFISPSAYGVAKSEWVAEGLSSTAFDSKFKGFRNPTDTYSVGK